jgi:hypothetical protein
MPRPPYKSLPKWSSIAHDVDTIRVYAKGLSGNKAG